MIAVDTNFLVDVHREDSDFHDGPSRYSSTLRRAAVDGPSPGPVYTSSWPTTHPRNYVPPTPTGQALEAIQAWLDSPMCEMIGEEPGYFEVLKGLVVDGKIAGPAVHDARIAAICIHHNVQALWAADRDFSRFGALKTHNPVAAN